MVIKIDGKEGEKMRDIFNFIGYIFIYLILIDMKYA
jgi:hypothetical protein